MDIGVTLPHVGGEHWRPALLEAARAAEEADLSSIWVSDHIAFPVSSESAYPYSRSGQFPVPFDTPFLEALVCLGFVAGVTERIGLGLSVLILPLRNTLVLAKQLATLAVLAPERLILGVGAGWLREEFEVLGAQFAPRGRILDEQIAALKGLWRQERFSQLAEYVSFPPILMEPRPSTLPPLWVGGTSQSALRRAGRFGDAWHAIAVHDPNEVGASMQLVREAAEHAGRDPEQVALTARIGGRPGAEGIAVLEKRAIMLQDVGCRHLVVDPPIQSREERSDFYEKLGGLARQLGQR